jgi:hypothetical protein
VSTVQLANLVGPHVLEAFGTYQEESSAADWIINDIQIGHRSQFTQAGALPGDMFSTNTIDAFVSFETVQTAMDLVLTATNMAAEAAVFHGAFIGRDVASGGREVLPMSSSGLKVQPEQTVQITSRPQHGAFRPERLMISGHQDKHVLLAFSDGLYDFSSCYGNLNVSKIEDEERSDAFLETMPRASDPDLIFLRLHNDTLLYAVSERTGLVVFEAGMTKQRVFDDDQEGDDANEEVPEDEEAEDGVSYGPRAPRVVTKHFLRFDPEGFVPEWLPMAQADESRLPSTPELR